MERQNGVEFDYKKLFLLFIDTIILTNFPPSKGNFLILGAFFKLK